MSDEQEKIQVTTLKDGTIQIEKLKQIHIVCDKKCLKKEQCIVLEELPCLATEQNNKNKGGKI